LRGVYISQIVGAIGHSYSLKAQGIVRVPKEPIVTSINSAQSSDVRLQQYSPPNNGALNDVQLSRREQALSIATDPTSSPREKGQALAELDNIAGKRVLSDSYLIAQAATNATTLGQRSVGNDRWGERTKGAVNQLRYESALNVADPKYSKALANGAALIEQGKAGLPEGTYRQVSVPNNIEDRRQNPIEVDKISPENAWRTIQKLDEQIENRNNRIADLKKSNADLRGSIFAVLHVPQIAANEVDIKRLESLNVLDDLSRLKTINDTRLQNGRADNGTVFRAVATGADQSIPPIIVINGVNTDVNRSAIQAMEMSALFKAPVDHVVNVSSSDKLISGVKDTFQDRARNRKFGVDHLDMRNQQHLSGNPPAAEAAAELILYRLDTTKDKIKIIGYSQGAAIGAEALRMVDSILTKRGLSLEKREEMLSRIEFLGIGPAAADRHISRSYQEGNEIIELPALKAVDYRTVSDINDPISKLVNVYEINENGEVIDGQAAFDARLIGAAYQFTSPGGVLPHLSYYKSYEVTDPGSKYNSDVEKILHQWYAGNLTKDNNLIEGENKGRRSN
jgi:hypothetical protein